MVAIGYILYYYYKSVEIFYLKLFVNIYIYIKNKS